MSLTARIERLDRGLRVVRPAMLSPLPLDTPADVLAVLTEAVNAVRADTIATPLERARALGLLAGWEEGIELNLFGLTFGVNPKRLALKLPILGNVGLIDIGKPRTIAEPPPSQ